MAAVTGTTPTGALRRRLRIETPVEEADGVGGRAVSWRESGAVWARLDWNGGGERWRQGRPEQAGELRIVLRWRAGLEAGHRFRDGARLFDIKAVGDPDGSRRRLVCLAEEISR